MNLTKHVIWFHQKIKLENIICCRFLDMKRFVFILSFCIAVLSAQPKEGIEFKVNTISGYVIDSTTSEPMMDVDIDIYTGNNVLKHSTITDEYGFYSKNIIGYLWKPKIKFSYHNYRTKKFRIDPSKLDSAENIIVNTFINPLPLDERIPDLARGTIINRAETFFIKGNVFYYSINKYKAERIIIQSAEAIETEPGFIYMLVNNKEYDVSKCYVPQEGQYENLSFILKSLLTDPMFEESGNPRFLPEALLKPSIIYGSVFNVSNGEPVMGAEIILSEPYKRRMSDENGKFAFQVEEPGSYHVSMNPPPGFRYSDISTPEILIKYGRGGWYISNFYVQP